jgi:hypothetical protein
MCVPPVINFINLNDLLFIVSVPVVLLALCCLLGWRFRGFVGRSTRNPPVKPPVASLPSSERASPRLASLVLRRLETSAVDPAPGHSAVALSEAEMATRRGYRAYTAAGLFYMTITTLVMTLGMPALVHNWPAYAKFLFVYQRLGPALFLLVWFARFSLPAQCAILGGYLLVGLLALPIGLASLGLPMSPDFLLRNASSVGVVSWYTLVLPMAALLLLLSKPLRPWLVGVLAIALYLLSGVAICLLIEKVFKLDWRLLFGMPRWEIAGSFICMIMATVFVGWALKHRSWRLPLAWLVLAASTGLLVDWLLPSSKIGLIPLGFSSNVLQVLFVWSLFKAFMLLQEWQSLPAQVLHSHLCWGFLAFYASVMSSYMQQWWTSWTVALAYGLYVVALHSLLRRLRATRVDRPSKRLLLLRVFGADPGERLFDLLDDTWRHIGRIDLIAGTDLAMRTLGSRMLEAFLLRRTDEQFLKTPEEVDRRLEHLHWRLEGDARYAINSVYCYANAWQRAVESLAPKSDVVLMDLRGFTNRNQGCVIELTLVVQRIPLSRIVLLADASSDYQALEEVAQAAWAQLPPESPNADLCEPVLTILNAPQQLKKSRSALFRLLMRAAYPPTVDDNCGTALGTTLKA